MKNLIITLLMAAGTCGLNAQSFGVRAGGEFATAKADFDGFKISDNETGFYLGVFARVEVSEKFNLRPEVNYVGVKDLDQIQVPILAEIGLVDKLRGQVGPNLGFLLNQEEGVKTFNLGANLGLSYEFTPQFYLEARYNLGLSNLSDDEFFDASLKLSAFEVGLAYGF